MRQFGELQNPENFNYIQKDNKAGQSKASQVKIKTKQNQNTSRSGLLGNSKGNKPARFNEDLEARASASQTLSMSEYLHNTNVEPNRKIKVNLRSINNPEERDRYKMLQRNRTNFALRP